MIVHQMLVLAVQLRLYSVLVLRMLLFLLRLLLHLLLLLLVRLLLLLLVAPLSTKKHYVARYTVLLSPINSSHLTYVIL
jgi:hypothetical protein